MGKRSIFGMRDGLSSGLVRKGDTKRMRSTTNHQAMATAKWIIPYHILRSKYQLRVDINPGMLRKTTIVLNLLLSHLYSSFWHLMQPPPNIVLWASGYNIAV